MRYVAAYLLVALSGKDEVTAADVKNVLTKAGVEIDAARLAKLFEDVADKSIDEIIAAGSKKLASFGGAAPAAAAAPAAGAAAAAPAAKEEKKEEEEADLGGGMDMFGGGSDY
ncbi:50S ribosomal protein LP2 [Saprolegnia diclina VS20]|uniref:50S ribosomal protein LP2 n=1 Tax=Saprolegnia diclina (strain VS20) TaxID=1156394 RepID=T0S7C6_SAPDV|nr:50S ribosomal protein LP2 [Saprolegnia diclina VS20]EQC38592.1 50S ribosomal protein LP2 [Saprolegnia diclina VS20]|eukprot:XP_008608184.1 50S ribosomal protein LP2 [Saprolegnia diclina VS20]